MTYIFLRFPEGKEKALTLSYDDGSRQDLKLLEIADRHGIKVTLNINSSELTRDPEKGRITIDELKTAQAHGHEIATHGARHLAPGLVSSTVAIRDTLDCRRSLEEAFGGVIRGMAYPDSGITKFGPGIEKSEIEGYLKSLGIAYSRSLSGDNNRFELPQDLYNWIPTAHHKNPELFNWLDEFLNKPMPGYISSRSSMLFYMWGHSFEFRNNNNWDRFEEFCEKAGGHDAVWYATNIEIADYINAFNSLVFNVECTEVYNPTCRKIWFEGGRKLYSVEPGQTLKLD